MSSPEGSGSEGAAYVYGITPADAAAPDVPGIGATAVRLVQSSELAALVSDVDRPEVESARSMRAHARVLDAAIDAGPVVPLRFGTMVADESAVVSDVLQRHADRFGHLLERLGRHVELAVKVSYDEDAVVRELVASDPGIAARHERIAGVDQDAAYYERIELGEQVAAALEQRRDRDAAEIYDSLCEIADEVNAKEPLNPHMVLNGTFLVRRTKVDAFHEAIEESTRAHPEMRVRFVGPLPPYSFTDVELVS
ncbi:MAG TPA: GvpL/GvpF family gas vesicle protein [Acidimicrobiales bacterium]|nr:GvpL/GvpF family gas vesicle protein [Acidimicrobiales bacterium]